MSWYLKYIFAQVDKLVSYLQSIGANPDIANYIMSQPNPAHRQFLVNEFRKNPSMTLQQLQGTQQPQQIDPYLGNERGIAQQYPDMAKWILVNLRRLRGGVLFNDEQMQRFLGTSFLRTYTILIDKLPEIKDWYNDIQPELASYSAEQAIAASDEWHKMMAEKGEGKYYEPTKSGLVVYGPKWRKEKWNGWTVQEIRSKNDLEVEGNRMSHCIAAYYDDVEKGNARIYSLRDPTNNPKVTIQTNGKGDGVQQIEGFANRTPDEEYKYMISEWVMSGIKAPTYYDTGAEVNWDIGGSLEGIAWQLGDLRNEYIEALEDDEDYQRAYVTAYEYGLDVEPKSEIFDAWLNNLDLPQLMTEIFEHITYEYGGSPFVERNVNWGQEKVVDSLIETVEHYDKKENTKKHMELLKGILKEQLGDYPTLLSEYDYERETQKDFAQYVLSKIYEPKGQTELDFPAYEQINYPHPAYASSGSWYKKTLDKSIKNVIIAQMKKELIIMRGLPGSGKSFLAKQLAGETGVICSADDFLYENGEYVWTAERVMEAHRLNGAKIMEVINTGASPIVVDNTNVSRWELRQFKPIIEIAMRKGYEARIEEPNTPWAFNAEELAKRNSHGADKERIENRMRKWVNNPTVEEILNDFEERGSTDIGVPA